MSMTLRLKSKLLVMAGTVAFALLPLIFNSWKEAMASGAFLAVSFASSSDAAFRCLDPTNKGGGLTKTLLGMCSVGIPFLAALEYGPIANDLRKESSFIQQSVETKSISPLAQFEKEREEDQNGVPNNSVAVLISSVVVELCVIILLEGWNGPVLGIDLQLGARNSGIGRHAVAQTEDVEGAGAVGWSLRRRSHGRCESCFFRLRRSVLDGRAKTK